MDSTLSNSVTTTPTRTICTMVPGPGRSRRTAARTTKAIAVTMLATQKGRPDAKETPWTSIV